MRSASPVFIFLSPLMLLAGCADEPRDAEADAGALSGAAAEPVSPAEATAAAAPPPAFAQCRSCHSVEPGRHGIGSSLHGIVGQRAASTPGFRFSTALQQSGIVWNRETLDEWLEAPMKMVPGTRMVLGVRDEKQRREIIDYLETLE